LEFVLPTVQADFAIVESYEYRSRAGLSIPLLAFHGTEDQTVDGEKVKDWQEESRGRFQICSFPGGHFFFAEREEQVVSVAMDFLHRSPG
jgi:surfactin synthase thioesterase subunit